MRRHRQLPVELPSQADHRPRGNAVEVQRHLAVVLAPVAVQHAGRPLEDLLWHLASRQGCAWLDERQRQIALLPSATPPGAEAAMAWQLHDQRLLQAATAAPDPQIAL